MVVFGFAGVFRLVRLPVYSLDLPLTEHPSKCTCNGMTFVNTTTFSILLTLSTLVGEL